MGGPAGSVRRRSGRGVSLRSSFPDRFQTARLALRPIASEDAAIIFSAYTRDLVVARFTTWRPHRDQSETDAYVASCLAAPPDVSRTYVLAERTTGAFRGSFHLRRPAPHRIELGYLTARPWWGQGLMTEVLTAVVDWAMRQPATFRIGAVCDVENIASARVMEKSGMAREGVLRRWMIHPNVGDEPRNASATLARGEVNQLAA